MDGKLILETAVLTGKIMLMSGAEVYRVEDTIRRILQYFGYDPTELVVLTTGIFATLDRNGTRPVTLVKRVPDRATNINRIHLANDISRRICMGEMSVAEANEKLRRIEHAVQYGPFLRALGLVGVSAFFAPMFGGGPAEFLAAAVSGIFLALTDWWSRRMRFNDFCMNASCAAMIALSAFAMKNWIAPGIQVDVIIISTIMPLVPGVVFTTAIRDTLNGDYAAGVSRILEAVIAALAVAAGVGFGMWVVQTIGGGRIW